MPRIKSEEKNNEMSIEFIKSCKNDISKFGFNLENYFNFLISVKAMKDSHTVLLYSNADLEKYRNMFLKKNEKSVEDSMQLEKFRIKSSSYDGENSIKFFTGYFTPKSFWDKIYKINIYE